MTILISSHLLGELHHIATKYGIINEGQMIEEIDADELDRRCKKSLHIKVDDVNRASLILEEELKCKDFKVLNDNTIKLLEFVDNPRLVSQTLAKEGIIIEGLSQVGDDLESYFINLIGGCLNE